jgi:hypothetical protein
MLQRTALFIFVGDVMSFRCDEWFSRRKPGSFDIMSLVIESDFLRNNKSVPNVAKNMVDLINIKQMHIYSLFCWASQSFKGWATFPQLSPNAWYRYIAYTIVQSNPIRLQNICTHHAIAEPCDQIACGYTITRCQVNHDDRAINKVKDRCINMCNLPP